MSSFPLHKFIAHTDSSTEEDLYIFMEEHCSWRETLSVHRNDTITLKKRAAGSFEKIVSDIQMKIQI